ncbi:MAG: PAS domain S-box protein [Chthoniobacteraceae bacterium]
MKRLRDWLCAEDFFYAKLLASSLVGVLAITVLASIFLLVSLRDHRDETYRSNMLEVLRDVNKAENDFASLQTCYRGYMLTGQDQFRNSLQQRQSLLQSRLTSLQGTLKDDTLSQGRVAQAQEKLNAWVARVVKPNTAARQQQNSAAGINLENDDNLVDQARECLKALNDQLQASLNGHLRDEQYADQSYQVLMFIPKLEGSMSDMEDSEWTYLLSGDAAAKRDYSVALNQFLAFHGHLTVLMGNDLKSAVPLNKARDAVDLWTHQVAAPAINAKAAKQDFLPIVMQGNGRDLMATAHMALNDFEKQQSAVYESARRHAEIIRVLKATGFGLLCALAIGVLIGSSWYGFVAYSRHLRKVETAEAQTRSIIETTLDGVLTVNEQGVIKSFNPAAEKMFAVKSAEIIGRNLSRLIPQRLVLSEVAKAGAGSLVTMGQRQGFYAFPIEVSLNEMTVAHERHYVAIIRDISERKRSEETLRHIGMGVTAATGEEFLRSLAKQLSKALQSDYAFVVELARANPTLESTMLLAENGQMRSVQKFPIADTFCNEVLRKGLTSVGASLLTRYPDDELFKELGVESLVATPLVDFKGRAVGVMGIIHRKKMENIETAESTLQIFAARAAAEIERKRFAEDLAAEKERLAITLRSIGEGFIATDVEGNIQLFNNSAEKLTGWPGEIAMGKPLGEIFRILNERTRKPSANLVQRIIETGTSVGMGGSCIILSRDNAERIVEMNASPIRDKANQKIGVVLILRDITERQKLDEEHRKAEKLESLGVAAGGIAHDFNNLLTAIIGNLSLAMMNSDESTQITPHLTTAKKASVRAQELAQQLLTFAKGGAPIKKTSSIGQLIEETVSYTLRGSNIRCEFNLPSELWACEIDAGQIGQVLNNLALNAEQAMPAGGTVRVHCENFEVPLGGPGYSTLKPGCYVKISMQDEGIGIPEEYLKKIFDPYFTTKPKGSGLGLATSYSIIKNHSGLITVESKPGEGSTFYLFLPASQMPGSLSSAISRPAPKPAAAREEAPKPKPAKKQAPRKGRVLVLDDEEVICMLVTCALEPMGYEVVETHSGEVTLQVYEDAMKEGSKFDIVISDLTIPGGMGGLEMMKRMRELDPQVKAIVSSGYATDSVLSQYREHGFCACIAKPYEVEGLCKLVDEVFASTGETLIYHDFAHAQIA